MKRYAVKVLNEGKYKFYYILDNETYDVVLYPSKFLKHKIDANRSPNTVLLHGVPQSAGSRT